VKNYLSINRLTRRAKTGLILLAIISGIQAQNTPLSINGKLQVIGNHLCNRFGNPVQLRGVSTHGIQWYGWGKCLNVNSMNALANTWGADVIRAVLYPQQGGYSTNPTLYINMLDTIVNQSKNRGMYCIVDWHILCTNPWSDTGLAKTFFKTISKMEAGKGNVLYEICNEPCVADWKILKAYAEMMIPLIRANDPDGIIIAGTPMWSSLGCASGNQGQVEANPITGTLAYNVMYTFHFYAGSHGASYRTELAAASAIIPIFITEWGTDQASGDGANDFASSQLYMDLCRKLKISWCNWSFSDCANSSAVFIGGTCPGGPWTGSRLSQAGAWVQNAMANPPDSFPVTLAHVNDAGKTTGMRPEVRENGAALHCALLHPEQVRALVFDSRGRLVRTLTDSRMPAGNVTIFWDGLSDDGARQARGLYLAQIRIGNLNYGNKIILH
jgi:endoglucanase